MTNQVTYRKLALPVLNEWAPVAATDAGEVSLLTQSSLTEAWDANQATIQGILNGSPLPFSWRGRKSLTPLSPAILGQTPTSAVDGVTGQSYLAFGYGTGTGNVQRTTTAVWAQAHTGGTGWTTGDTATLTDGTVLSVVAVGGVVQGATVVSSAVYTNPPNNPVSVATTSGSGTGATFDVDCGTSNGSLVSPFNATMINTTGAISLIAVARVPVVGGVAGNTPGGIIVGNQLSQSSTADLANQRNFSLGVGYGLNGGRAQFRINGDNKSVSGPTGTDLRDGNWHVLMAGCTLSLGTTTPALWIDGAQVSNATFSSLALNTSVGVSQLRVGAAGPKGAVPNFGYAGDVGYIAVLNGIDLTLSGSASVRQSALNYLMGRFGVGGTSA